MKIHNVHVYTAENNLAGKVWNPKIRWLIKHSILLEVVTEDGLRGIGECWCFDRTPDALVAFLVHDVIPRIIGLDARNPAEISRLLFDTTTLSARHGIMASAVSGIDIALWDIAAKAQDKPLWRLLGGSDPEVAVYASGGLYGENKSPARLADELAGFVANGFDEVKMKIGALSADDDEERVRAVRESLGTGPRLIVDGVYSYSRDTAQAFYTRIADCNISAFQSPVPADDTEGMAALVAGGVPVLALEAEYRLDRIDELLRRRAVATLQFALVACGGISAGLKIVGMASAANIPCSLEVSSTAIAQMAAFQFAAAQRQVISSEVHMVHQVLFDTIADLTGSIRAGRLTLSERPGLGIDLPLERLDQRA